jgi:hypothetical protein
MRSPAILIVVCVVVLAGAYFASRMLVNDGVEQNPNVLTVVSAPPDAVQPATISNVGRPSPNREEAQRAMLGPRPGPLTPVQPVMPHAVDPTTTGGQVPPLGVAPSPYQGDSKELDYAESLLAETNPPVERLQSAHQVLSRCLDAEPENQRCKAAMVTAQRLLGPKAASERQPGLPTLQTPAPQVPVPK